MTRFRGARPLSRCEEESLASRPVDPRIQRAQRGDREAAGALLEELLPKVRNLVRYLVRGDAEVDDLSQKALLAILQGLKSYRGEGELVSWANKITVRETIRSRKKDRADRAALSAIGPELELLSAATPDPDRYLARRAAVRRLETLPEDQRDVVVLHHVLGMSVPELADELGLPFDTAKSRLRLGMEKLRAEEEAP